MQYIADDNDTSVAAISQWLEANGRTLQWVQIDTKPVGQNSYTYKLIPCIQSPQGMVKLENGMTLELYGEDQVLFSFECGCPV